MMHEIPFAALALTAFLVLCSYLYWALHRVVEELKATQRQFNSSQLLTKKFDQAAKLIGDLDGLQEQVSECKSGLHNTMYYVKKLRAEFLAQNQSTAQLLARLDKLETELRGTSGEIKESVAKAYKLRRYYDIHLSPRAPFPFGDVEDGENDSSAQQLIPGNFL